MDGEIVTRVERRRQWSPEEKAALLAEVEAEGGRVSVVAKRHRISYSLLYNWRSVWKAVGVKPAVPAPASEGFVQLGIVSPAVAPLPVDRAPSEEPMTRGTGLTLAERVGVIEIDLPDGVRIRVDGTVSDKALRRVLLALRESR